MNDFIRLELKKIFNKNTIIIGILFMILILIPMFFNAQGDVVKDDGSIYSGIWSYKILKERSAPVEGVMTSEYIKMMRDHYQNGIDKKYVEGLVDTEKKLGIRLMYPQDQLHWLLNFPYNRVNSLYNDLNLSDDQLDHFYDNWKNAFQDYLKNPINQFSYTDKQISLIVEKVRDIHTPFVNKYNMGWWFLKINLSDTIYIFFIFLNFILSEVFSKQHKMGIDQIILSTKESRKKLVNYKIQSANIFATIAYFSYILILLAFIWIIYSFHGWDSFGSRTNIFNLNFFQDGIAHIAMGYLATLVVTQLILFLSMLMKRGKIVLLILLIYFYKLNSYKMTSSAIIQKINIFMPQNFVNNLFDIRNLFFVGNRIVPYIYIACFLGIIYIIFFRMLTKLIMKKYYLK